MGWLPIVAILEPIFPTLVRAFYLRATYGLSGSIISTVKRVEIRLDSESIYRILDIAPVGLKVYESKARGQGQVHPGVEEKVEIREMEGEVDPQKGFEQREPELDIPPLQSEGIQFEATFLEPMMSELTYIAGPSSQPSFTKPSHTETSPHQISSLSTRMEELAVVSKTRLYSMEDRINQYQTGFTSQFEYLQQRFECMEDHMD
uniref:Uncharacterized protein n=1 Tax=Vitis vinifera TaxID=29760 RepID=A5B9F4_VITVI|nr:hypothetical protein VITISV_032480 [Vitis vinifera]